MLDKIKDLFRTMSEKDVFWPADSFKYHADYDIVLPAIAGTILGIGIGYALYEVDLYQWFVIATIILYISCIVLYRYFDLYESHQWIRWALFIVDGWLISIVAFWLFWVYAEILQPLI